MKPSPKTLREEMYLYIFQGHNIQYPQLFTCHYDSPVLFDTVSTITAATVSYQNLRIN
jgi:hypothetical protein